MSPFLNLLAGLVMPSDPLGNNGFGGLTGQLPFLGRKRNFQDGGSGNGLPDFGLIDPLEEQHNQQLLGGLAHTPTPGPFGSEPSVPGAPMINKPIPVPAYNEEMLAYPNANRDAGFDNGTGSPLPPNGIGERDRLFTPTGYKESAANDNLGGSKSYAKGSDAASPSVRIPAPANQNGNIVPLKVSAVPPAYARTGMDQATWDKMNTPAAPAAPKMGAGAPVAKPGPKAAAVSRNAPTSSSASLEDLVDETLPKIFKAESGGRANAKNPLSSAAGLGQITKSTWEGLQHRHPELNLTNIYDPKQNAAATRALAVDNGKYLAARGLPITRGTLYLAHFLGAGGAADLLHSPDGVPMPLAVPHSVIAANPFLRNMTVGDVKAWAERKMGGKGVAVPTQNAQNAGNSNTSNAFNDTGDTNGPAEGRKHPTEVPPALEMSQNEQLQPPVEPEAMSHADKLAILQKFMALAGFSPSEIG